MFNRNNFSIKNTQPFSIHGFMECEINEQNTKYLGNDKIFNLITIFNQE